MAMAPPSPHVNKKDSNVNEGIPRNDQIPQPLPPYQKPEEAQNDHKLNPKSNESNVNKRGQGISSHKPLPQDFLIAYTRSNLISHFSTQQEMIFMRE